jgi:hypothetical protein
MGQKPRTVRDFDVRKVTSVEAFASQRLHFIRTALRSASPLVPLIPSLFDFLSEIDSALFDLAKLPNLVRQILNSSDKFIAHL